MKRSILAVLAIVLIATAVSGCSQKEDKDVKERAKLSEELDKIKLSDYMEEDQARVEKIIDSIRDKAENADMSQIAKLSHELKTSLREIKPKAEQIENLKKQFSKLTEGLPNIDRKKAEEILDSIDYNNVKSLVDLRAISDDTTEKLRGVSSSMAEKLDKAKEEVKQKIESLKKILKKD